MSDIKKVRLTREMLVFLNRAEDPFGLQVTWPHFSYRKCVDRRQFYIQADTTLNLQWDNDSVIFGVVVLGFGGGIYWKFRKNPLQEAAKET